MTAPTPRRKRPVARSAARLGAVQALYQMDLAGTDVGEVLAQFSSRAAGEAFDEGQCGEADYRLLKDIVDGAVREQATIDPTVNEVEDNVFGINIIPHTLAVTTWGSAQAGDRVNVEIDMLARYVARLAEFSSL